MSFPKDSAWGQDQQARGDDIPDVVRGTYAEPYYAAKKTAAIPYSELENWIASLEVAENGGDIEDVLISMRSHFRG